MSARFPAMLPDLPFAKDDSRTRRRLIEHDEMLNQAVGGFGIVQNVEYIVFGAGLREYERSGAVTIHNERPREGLAGGLAAVGFISCARKGGGRRQQYELETAGSLRDGTRCRIPR